MLYSQKLPLRIPLRILISILIIGALFKIMHWPGANVIMVSAFGTIAIIYPFRFYKKAPKLLIDYVKLVLVLVWSIRGVFSTLHLPYAFIFNALVLFSFGLWIVLESIDYIQPENKEQTTFDTVFNVAFGFGAIFTLVGVTFKIMHWPYASLSLIIGLCLCALLFLKDIFRR